MARKGSAVECDLCGALIDPAGPAVVGNDSLHVYEPFVEDLRADPPFLAHTKCYAETLGFDAFQALVTAPDFRKRGFGRR